MVLSYRFLGISPEKECVMSTVTAAGVSFFKIAASLVVMGDYREANRGDHPLTRVSSASLEKLLSKAADQGNLMFWAVLCTLLRMRFGNFVHSGNVGPRKVLRKLREESFDDLMLSYVGMMDHLIQPFSESLSSLSDLFEGERRAKSEVFAHLLKTGFVDNAGISILVFLRDHQDSLPSSIEGDEVDPQQHISLMLPVLLAAYSGENGKFVLSHKGKFHGLVSNGKIGLPIEFASNLVCNPGEGKTLLLVGDNDFVAIVSESPTQEMLKAAACQDFLKRYRELMGQDADLEEESNLGPAAAPAATEALANATRVLSLSEKLSAVQIMLDQLGDEQRQLKVIHETSKARILELEGKIEAENSRHDLAIQSENERHQAALAELKALQEEEVGRSDDSWKRMAEIVNATRNLVLPS